MPDADRAPRADAWRARVDATLDACLPGIDAQPAQLHGAMRHAVLDGGKRMRPMLVYATGTAFGADESLLDSPAAAVELIHAYSLVHDDLPSMDDDALRRGKPTVHVAFGEANAILAGDALQALAFELLAGAPLHADRCVAMIRELAVAAGASGMCGGQALDLDATGRAGSIDLHGLRRMHAAKTGALLRAAVRLGAITAGVDPVTQLQLDRFADALGLAFQIRDDLLDVEGDSATLGKTAGKDANQAKATYPALLGLEGSRARLADLAVVMQESLAPFGARTAVLAQLGTQAFERSN